MDVRFDQSKIGCINKVTKANGSRVKSVQAIASFPDSLQRYLPQVLEKLFTFQHDSKDTLVLLVKQFRVSDRLLNMQNQQFEPELLLRLSLSAFRRKEAQVTKLFSIDQLFSKKLRSDMIPKEEVMNALRKEALTALFQSIFSDQKWQKTGSSFALSAVQQGIQQRFQLPVITDTLLQAGAYRSFSEFKQNAPSIRFVQFRMNKDEVVSVTDASGDEIDPQTIWGFCNGTKRFIVFRNEFCELQPSDKGFFFSSYTRKSDLSGAPSFGDYAPQTGILSAALTKAFDNKSSSHIFYLNMDDETIHLEDIFGKSSLKQMEKELLK